MWDSVCWVEFAFAFWQVKNLRTNKKDSPHTFCKLFVGDIPLGMSSTVKDSDSPRWQYDTELHFMCNVRVPEIRVEVFSQSTVSNTYLGSCVVPLVDDEKLISIPHQQWVKLVDKDHCEYVVFDSLIPQESHSKIHARIQTRL